MFLLGVYRFVGVISFEIGTDGCFASGPDAALSWE